MSFSTTTVLWCCSTVLSFVETKSSLTLLLWFGIVPTFVYRLGLWLMYFQYVGISTKDVFAGIGRPAGSRRTSPDNAHVPYMVTVRRVCVGERKYWALPSLLWRS